MWGRRGWAGVGRQAGHSQNLGTGPEEGARKDLLLSGSWQARTLRAANHTECKPVQLARDTGTRGPAMVAGRVRGAVGSSPTRRQKGSQAEPKQKQKVSGGDDRKGQP